MIYFGGKVAVSGLQSRVKIRKLAILRVSGELIQILDDMVHCQNYTKFNEHMNNLKGFRPHLHDRHYHKMPHDPVFSSS